MWDDHYVAEPDQHIEAIQRVLLVDDSRLQRRLLSASLKGWGFDLREAASGREALEICRDWPPDLILSDWMMPGMDGLAFCRAFRQLQQQNYGYFILLTSKSDKRDIVTGLDAGADDFLTKPPNAPELRARIMAGDRIVRMQQQLSEQNRLIRSTLDELQAVYTSIDNDLIEARKLQQSLLRERYRDYGMAALALILRSSGRVGGDLVGAYPINDTQIGIYGIDVSGHGISSALMTARLAGYLSAFSIDQNVAITHDMAGNTISRPPSETLALLNDLILNEMQTEHYFTMLLATVDLSTRQIVMAQAGHPHPALQRAGGKVEFPGRGGLPVGLFERAEYQDTELQLAPGDRFLIYSDGVIECSDPAGNFLDGPGLARILQDLHGMQGIPCLEALLWKLSEFRQDQGFDDDVSAALLEFKSGAASC